MSRDLDVLDGPRLSSNLLRFSTEFSRMNSSLAGQCVGFDTLAMLLLSMTSDTLESLRLSIAA